MKEKLVIGLAVASFFFGYAFGYKKEKKNAEIRRELFKKRKIIVN